MLKLRRRRDVPHTMAVVPGDNNNNNNNNDMNRNVEQPASSSSSSTSSGKAFKYIIFILAIVVLITIGYHLGLLIGRLIHNTALEYEYDYDAVVVGAGWAGIRAAKTLIDAGISSVLVLEANDYVGGRVKSINIDNSINDPTKLHDMTNIPIDMGGEWLYDDNDMALLLERHGYLNNIELHSDKDEFLDLYSAQYYLSSDGNSKKARILSVAEEKKLYETVWNAYLKFREEQLVTVKGVQSVDDVVNKFKKERLGNNITEIAYFDMILNIGVIDYAAELSELNAKDYYWYSPNKVYPMTLMSQVGVGFGNTAASVADPYMSKIKLNAKVTEINYEDPNLVVVSYTDETSGEKTRQVTTRTILVTVSLGVLKAETINFRPKLPEWKQDVIDGMGYGVLNKCIMQWNNKDDMVWPANETWFELITPEGPVWTSFFNPTQFKGGKPTLVGWIGGDGAKAIEAQTDEEVTNAVMKKLQTLFPGIRSPPDRVLVTRWGKEPNILGTYSFKAVGRDWKTDSRSLRRKINKIRFAGEATSGMWYDTTYGAWKSGNEEAKEMISDLRTELVNSYASGI